METMMDLLPSGLIPITVFDVGATFLILMFGLITVGLSDNVFFVKARNGKTWRSHYTEIVSPDNYTNSVHVIGVYFKPNILFGSLVVRIDALLILFVVYYIYSDNLSTKVAFPIDFICVFIILWLLRNAYIYYIRYFSLSAVSNDDLVLCYKRFFRKTICASYHIADIDQILIRPRLFLYPSIVIDLELRLKSGSRIHLVSGRSLVADIMAMTSADFKTNIYWQSSFKPGRYKGLFGEVCSSFSCNNDLSI